MSGTANRASARSGPREKQRNRNAFQQHRIRGLGFATLLAVAAGSGALLFTLDWPIERAIASVDGATGDDEPTQSLATTLAQSTLRRLDDGNRASNYAVLHALAAPAFQAANSPDQLGRIFADLRRTGADLARAARRPPRWMRAPAIGPDGLLRMHGAYDDSPHRLEFAMAFAAIADTWRLIEINVATRPHKR